MKGKKILIILLIIYAFYSPLLIGAQTIKEFEAEIEKETKELEEIIKRVQNEMRKTYGLTIQFQLIGSGKRHLVTRIRGGNSGYDFDYNLIIQRWGDMYNSKDMVVKQGFMDAFKEAVKGTPYSSPKDSTSAITI